MVRFIVAGVGLMALGLLAGCGSGFTPPQGVVVTGKVLQGGQPLPVTPTDDGYNGVHVQFFGTGPNQSATEDDCDASGNFELRYAGDGIAPGKYKVAITVRKGGPETDELGGKLAPDATTIEVDVPADKLGGSHDVGLIELNDHIK